MKLASIETIKSLKPIEGCDKICLATVLGWELVVKIEEFQVGDPCVYIPIDTVVDRSKEYFKFLKKDRIQTEKIRGVFSQGLALPLGAFRNKVEGFVDIPTNYKEDLGPLIGVSKYEKQEPKIKLRTICDVTTGGDRLYEEPPGFPLHLISRTDEDNLKSNVKVLDELKGLEIYVTQKQDGSSMTAIWHTNESTEGTLTETFMLCSRNIVLMKLVNGVTEYETSTPSLMVTFAKRMNLAQKFTGKNIALQGEFCGPTVNGNRLKFPNNEFHWFIFNIKDLITRKYHNLDALKSFVMDSNMELVPILDQFVCGDQHTLESFQEMADQVKYGTNKGEGIVIRPIEPKYSPHLEKYLSVKIINREYKD